MRASPSFSYHTGTRCRSSRQQWRGWMFVNIGGAFDEEETLYMGVFCAQKAVCAYMFMTDTV